MATDLNPRQRDIYVAMTSFLDGKGTEDFMAKMKTILRTGGVLVDVDIEHCKTPSDVVTKLKARGKISLLEGDINLANLIKLLEQMNEIYVKDQIVEYERDMQKQSGHDGTSTGDAATQTRTKAAPEGATGGARKGQPGTVNINQSNIDNRGGKIIGNMNITANNVQFKQ